MSGTQDTVTGKTKEALGDLTDDKELQREGKTEQTAGKAKDKLDDANDWLDEKIDEAKDAVKRERS